MQATHFEIVVKRSRQKDINMPPVISRQETNSIIGEVMNKMCSGIVGYLSTKNV